MWRDLSSRVQQDPRVDTMPELTLESLDVSVREFFHSLSNSHGDTVLIADGKPHFHIHHVEIDLNQSWSIAKNARRFELIDREIDGSITTEEHKELESLQMDLRRYRRRVCSLPIGENQKLLQDLAERSARLQRPTNLFDT